MHINRTNYQHSLFGCGVTALGKLLYQVQEAGAAPLPSTGGWSYSSTKYWRLELLLYQVLEAGAAPLPVPGAAPLPSTGGWSCSSTKYRRLELLLYQVQEAGAAPLPSTGGWSCYIFDLWCIPEQFTPSPGRRLKLTDPTWV